MDCLNAAITSSNKANTTSTTTKHNSSFILFQKFLQKCNIQDPFLETYNPNQRSLILCGFAHSVRKNHHQSPSKTKLAGTTVAATISNVVQAFRKNLGADPTIDNSGAKSVILTNQLRDYKNTDPPTKHQACLPLVVWKRMYRDKANPLNTAMDQLLVGALFFAMRSCEYTSTPNQSEKRTKLLRLRNIRIFTRDKRGFMKTIPHSSPLKVLSAAQCGFHH